MAGVVIVTTPQPVALGDARRGLRMFQQLGVTVLGLVENMSYFIPPDLPNRRYDIFGSGGGEALAAEMGVPLLGQVPLELPVREGGDLGQPILIADRSLLRRKPYGRSPNRWRHGSQWLPLVLWDEQSAAQDQESPFLVGGWPRLN